MIKVLSRFPALGLILPPNYSSCSQVKNACFARGVGKSFHRFFAFGLDIFQAGLASSSHFGACVRPATEKWAMYHENWVMSWSYPGISAGVLTSTLFFNFFHYSDLQRHLHGRVCRLSHLRSSDVRRGLAPYKGTWGVSESWCPFHTICAFRSSQYMTAAASIHDDASQGPKEAILSSSFSPFEAISVRCFTHKSYSDWKCPPKQK